MDDRTLDHRMRMSSFSSQASGESSDSGQKRKSTFSGRDVGSLPRRNKASHGSTGAVYLHKLKTISDFRNTISARASKITTTTLTNETWLEVVSSQNMHGHGKLAKKSPNLPLCDGETEPLMVTPTTPKIMAGSIHVSFSLKNKEIKYEVNKDDIANSWLDMDVSSALEASQNQARKYGMSLCFGPDGTSTAPDASIVKSGKTFMVRIQKPTLINEMHGQRVKQRQAVIEEQASQRRNGKFDIEEICSVSTRNSNWGVELAKSSWWLHTHVLF